MPEGATNTPSPQPAGSPRNWRGVILFLGAAALLVGAFFLVQYFFSPPGSLQVTTTKPGAKVTVGGKEVGVIAWRDDLRMGSYLVEVTDASRSAQPWWGQVSIQPSALTSVDRDLGPSEQFSSGSVLTLSHGSGLAVTSSPASAKVSLDGTDIGPSPLSRPNPGPGNHELKFSLDGYLDKTVEINVTNGWKLDVKVDLYKNPDFGVALVDTQDIKPASPSELKIASREEVGLDKMLDSLPASSYSAWTSAQLWNLEPSGQTFTDQPTEWLKGLYYHAVNHLLLPDFPWHYLIDKSGNIYEGRSGGFGVTSLDVSGGLTQTAQAPTLKPGLVLVGYLGGSDVTPAAKDSFKKLVTWLGQPPKLAATPEDVAPINLDAEKTLEVTISYKNTGVATWQNFGDNRITLTTVGGTSLFYTAGNWFDPVRAVTAVENYVPKGQAGTFKLTLTAPKYGGDYEQSFNLLQGSGAVDGSQVKLKIHVTGPAKPAAQVKILDTGTGFLRVRSGPGLNFGEVARVKPGEVYEYLDVQPGWYKIKVSDTVTGWVSSQFATKI